MKSFTLFLLVVLCRHASAEFIADVGVSIVSMEDFPTSVRKQLTKAGVLDAFETAESITVQLISSPDDQNVTENGKIAEGIIRPESKQIILTPKQRSLLLATLTEDSIYSENMASCLCFFTPQLRVTFLNRESKKHFDIFLSGASHGEIRAIEGGREIAYTRTWKFIPQYLVLMDHMFPTHPITRRLHTCHEQRLQELANHSPEPAQGAVH